jgi:2-phosphosulfolactate phosphatase
MQKAVVIDRLTGSAWRYRQGWAIVVIDVIRATTTAITAAASGRRCFPAPSAEAALAIAARLDDPLLAGEQDGNVPGSFEMDNSPALLSRRCDTHRPLVLVSSSGTRVIDEAAGCDAVYLASFRNYSALAPYLARRHERVAVIGAGTKGEFREEDQICCAWIAAELMFRGYSAATAETSGVVDRWRNAPADACLCSHSIDFLKRTGKLLDLEYVLAHINDLRQVFEVRHGEVLPAAPVSRRHRRALRRRCA